MKITWKDARRLASAVVRLGGEYSRPGRGGVDCAEAVRRVFAEAGLSRTESAAWMILGTGLDRLRQETSFVEQIAEQNEWHRVYGQCRALPKDVRPLDCVLSLENGKRLHLSCVVDRGRLLTSVFNAGVCVVPAQTLGSIVGIYRHPELA